MINYPYKTAINVYSNDEGECKVAVDYNASTDTFDQSKVVASALLIAMSDQKVFAEYIKVAKNELERLERERQEANDEKSE